MTRRPAFAAAALLLAAVVPARAAETAPADLQEFDRHRQQLWERTWNWAGSEAFSGTDLAGRRFAQAVNSRLMNAADVAQLDALRARAVQQLASGDVAGRTTLNELDRALQRQEEAQLAFSVYAEFVQRLRYHRSLWERAMATAPETSASQSRQSVDEAEKSYRQSQLAAVPFIAATEEQVASQLLGVYQRERIMLAQMPGREVQMVPRVSACPPPSNLTPGTHRIRSLGSATAVADIYPQADRRYGVEGRVVLRLQVAASGCLVAYGVAQSTGAPSLDQAAMEWVEDMRFEPAATDGVAYESEVMLPVMFRLEQASPAAAAPQSVQ